MSRMSRSLYFIHIPKCAGTSMRQALLDIFPTGNIVDSWKREDIFEMDLGLLSQADLIMSHSGRLYSNYIDRALDYILVAREPFDLFKSRCLHMMKDQGHVANSDINKLGIAEFIRSKNYINSTANIMTRHLLVGSLDNVSLLEEDAENIDFSARQIELNCRAAESMELLDQIRYISVIDQSEDLIDRIYQDRNWPSPRPQRLNVNSDAIEFDWDAFADEFYDANALDMSLWNTISISHFSNKTPLAFRISDAIIKNGNVPLDGPYVGEGWHTVEREANGACARWTRGEACDIYLPTRCGIDHVLATFAVWTEDVVSDLKILVDGQLVSHTLMRNSEASGFEYFLLVPLKAKRPFVTLTFSGIRPVRPSELTGDEDTRLLGLRFKRLQSVVY